MDEHKRLVEEERVVHLTKAVAAEKVPFGEEDQDALASLDVPLEVADLDQVVDVEEHGHARQEQLQLALDGRDLVLAGAPDVREEEMPLLPAPKRELGDLLGLQQPDVGEAALLPRLPRSDGEETDQHGRVEGDHDVDDLVVGGEAHQVVGDGVAVLGGARVGIARDAFVQLQAERGDQDAHEHKERALRHEIDVLLLVWPREHEEHHEHERDEQRRDEAQERDRVRDQEQVAADGQPEDEEGQLPPEERDVVLLVQKGGRLAEVGCLLVGEGDAAGVEQRGVQDRHPDGPDHHHAVRDGLRLGVLGRVALDREVLAQEAALCGGADHRVDFEGLARPREEDVLRDGDDEDEGDEEDQVEGVEQPRLPRPRALAPLDCVLHDAHEGAEHESDEHQPERQQARQQQPARVPRLQAPGGHDNGNPLDADPLEGHGDVLVHLGHLDPVPVGDDANGLEEHDQQFQFRQDGDVLDLVGAVEHPRPQPPLRPLPPAFAFPVLDGPGVPDVHGRAQQHEPGERADEDADALPRVRALLALRRALVEVALVAAGVRDAQCAAGPLVVKLAVAVAILAREGALQLPSALL
mmetsp:Transcript_33877/g.79311  ORF Transcript_33877/g.79311 Transcript_33877/m.79311 type:complete len:582 (-) Transcript_33877:33-1778(-)